MNINIYQMRLGEGMKFHSYEEVQKENDVAERQYHRVFKGEVEASTLEDVYKTFNTTGHPLFRGHSLSVSDVIVVNNGGNTQAFFCDDYGFVPFEFDENLVAQDANIGSIVYVEPNKPAYASEIILELPYEQKAVGGLIEIVGYGGLDTLFIGNEEAKLMSMPGNRHIDGQVVAGNFFVIGVNGEDFRGLTPEEVDTYLDKFSDPEQITNQEVGNSLWMPPPS